MELRPRPSSPVGRRSIRIVSRAAPPSPNVIRIQRPILAPAESRVRRMSVREFFTDRQPIDLSEPATPLSISSESTQRTLSSADELSDDEVLEMEELSSGSESASRDDQEYSDAVARAAAFTQQTQSVDREDFRTDLTGLVNRPQIYHFIKTHTGRVKCANCDERIHRDQIRLDYRPMSRAAAVKHTHVACVGSNRSLYFPTRGEDLISFDEQFTDQEKREFVNLLRSSLRPEPPSIAIQRVVRLYPVVRGGDAHEMAIERREQQAEIRRRLDESLGGRYLNVRMDARAYLFQQTFGMTAAPYSGLNPVILESLPRVSVTPSETESPEEQEHVCVVCLETMTVTQKIIMLPCFHRFHEGCISEVC